MAALAKPAPARFSRCTRQNTIVGVVDACGAAFSHEVTR
jgi:hypothetical protein